MVLSPSKYGVLQVGVHLISYCAFARADPLHRKSTYFLLYRVSSAKRWALELLMISLLDVFAAECFLLCT